MRPSGEVYRGRRLRPGEYRKGYRLNAGITRRPERLFEFEKQRVGGRVHALCV